MYEHQLGLTNEEVAWIREHRRLPWPRVLTSLYNMVVSCPRDQAARTLFSCHLMDWRKSAEYPFSTQTATDIAAAICDNLTNPNTQR